MSRYRVTDPRFGFEATAYQLAFGRRLLAEGCEVWMEVPQWYSTPGRVDVFGRIDVVAVRAGQVEAYELDYAVPRVKSIAKLAAFPADLRRCVCRVSGSVLDVAPGLPNLFGIDDPAALDRASVVGHLRALSRFRVDQERIPSLRHVPWVLSVARLWRASIQDSSL